jgi:beta-N-acetylhexosaminidase
MWWLRVLAGLLVTGSVGLFGTPPAVAAGGPTLTAVVRYEQGSSRLTYSGVWTTNSTASASGGSFAIAHTSGASLTIRFMGTHLSWIAKKSPVYGKAQVTLDGQRLGLVDLYSASTTWRQKVWGTGSLKSGSHTVTIAWTGLKRAAATGTYVNIDAVEVTTLPLSPEQMAGQRVIYSYRGLTPPAGLLSLISHGEAAGVIFFADNISSDAQISAVAKTLRQAAASPQNPVQAPLLLMTDQEGGQIRRLSGAPLLSEKQIGASASPAAQATKAGSGAGMNLRSVGLNVNLAPVLDVYRRAGDFADQYSRSYSNNPAVVSKLGADFIHAQQHVGVAAAAKHFPGLGAATSAQNTDAGPVTLNVSLQSLHSVDELPYQAAIAVGVRLVMVSWAVYPAIAPGVPAGLSSAIVQGELRARLHFLGVTITDSLGAGALKAFGSFQHRAVLAAGAGMDLILCSSGYVSEGEQARAGLESGYLDGTLGSSAFQAALQRVIDLRSSLGS